MARTLQTLLVVCVVALGARVYDLHARTGDWTLRPSATPEKVAFGGRDYRRGKEVAGVEKGFVERSRSAGGGIIYAPTEPSTPTVIAVVAGRRVVEYALMGGP